MIADASRVPPLRDRGRGKRSGTAPSVSAWRRAGAPRPCASLLWGALVLGAALSAAACRDKSVNRSPVGVTQRLVEAINTRDTAAVWSLLGPATRARLEAAAAKATQLGGGKAKVSPQDLLSPAWRSEADADWKPKGFRLLGVEGEKARVEVTGAEKGQRAVVHLVKVKGRWRVELTPAPPPPPAKP